LMWNFYGNQFTYTRSDSTQERQGEYDGIHIRLYNEGENTDIILPIIDKTQRNPQAMIDWIPYAKTLPNHWAEINKVKNLFRVSSEGTNSDSVTFSSRRFLGGKNMMHELIISKTADGFNETCIKQDRTDYNINSENVIVERINGANAYNECFGNFTSLK
jgi:hypothetical protein